MKRSLLASVAAAALAATVVAGTTTTASAAKPDHARGHHAKPTKPAKPGKGDKRLATEQRIVTSQVATKDAALARAVLATTRAELPVGADEVLVNIAGDRLALADLKSAALSATTVAEVRLVGAQVKQVRPEIYSSVVNGLRQAASFQGLVAANTDSIAALSAQADAKELEGFDVTSVRETLADATLANEEAAALAAAALEKGVLLTAFSAQVDREAFLADVEGAGLALDAVDAALLLAEELLAALVVEPVVEPVVEQPLG